MIGNCQKICFEERESVNLKKPVERPKLTLQIIKETTSVIRSLKSWDESRTEMERRAMEGDTRPAFHCNGREGGNEGYRQLQVNF